jgi:hypothetical protein
VDLLAIFAADDPPKRAALPAQVKVAESARAFWGV